MFIRKHVILNTLLKPTLNKFITYVSKHHYVYVIYKTTLDSKGY
jgi:hypothetical protein